jgi:hypothetical protein
VALTLAAGSAAMAANLGILDRGNGVDVGDLSPVGSSTSVSTPATALDNTSTTDATTPTSFDDHGVDNPIEGPANGHDDGIPGDQFDDNPGADDDGPRATTPGSTPTTIDDHGGDRAGDDNSGPGNGGEDHSGPGRGGSDDDNSGHGGSGHGGDDD